MCNDLFVFHPGCLSHLGEYEYEYDTKSQPVQPADVAAAWTKVLETYLRFRGRRYDRQRQARFSQQRWEYKEEHGENMGTQPFC